MSTDEMAQKQVLARVYVKDMLKYFKRDSLKTMIDTGILRSQKELSIGLDLVPKLLG